MNDHTANQSLMVSPNHRYLVKPDGSPFFYLADTAWELFHRLSRSEADQYLQDRAAKSFTVIQAVVLAELDGLNTPNPAGHRPLIDNDPTRPNQAYFEDVDWIVNRAAELGLFIGMLPTWGDKWHKDGGIGPLVFNPENARVYGRFLGTRYRHAPIIWILGGDKFVGDEEEQQTLAAMAQGLSEGDGGRHLKTYHPIGQYSSAFWFHDAGWLDFNMIQTGHTRDRDNYTSIAAEYNRTPIKPVIDGEPGYENIAHGFTEAFGRLDAHQARKFCYWSLFSGACGHTYGCNDIWQMWKAGDKPIIAASLPWDQALHLPGSGQMQFARQLIESGPYFDRLPDQSLIAPPNPTGADHVAACRAPDGSYALVYIPTGLPVTIRTFLLKGSQLHAQWYDPRGGEYTPVGIIEVNPWHNTTFTPPGSTDWVLELRQG
ncbi:MAG TPA: DUF4038 domain-containing protein [Chloroflexi bacterium]|nr:DUF4038 domain-containing protein [Chloroflexota bacterium]